MAEKIVKNCHVHGALRADQCIKAGKERSGYQRWNCSLCYKDRRDRHYEKHREKVLAKTRAYRNAHPEKYAACQKGYRQRLQKEAGIPTAFLDNQNTNKKYRQARNKLVNVMCRLSLITRAMEKQSRRK